MPSKCVSEHRTNYARLTITGPNTWHSNRIFYQRKSDQCFCQDTVQIYSCNTMQFSEACHGEDTKTPLFPGLTGAVVTNLEMVARQFIHSPSWTYKPMVASSSIRLSSRPRTRGFIQRQTDTTAILGNIEQWEWRFWFWATGEQSY